MTHASGGNGREGSPVATTIGWASNQATPAGERGKRKDQPSNVRQEVPAAEAILSGHSPPGLQHLSLLAAVPLPASQNLFPSFSALAGRTEREEAWLKMHAWQAVTSDWPPAAQISSSFHIQVQGGERFDGGNRERARESRPGERERQTRPTPTITDGYTRGRKLTTRRVAALTRPLSLAHTRSSSLSKQQSVRHTLKTSKETALSSRRFP